MPNGFWRGACFAKPLRPLNLSILARRFGRQITSI